jgi:hypothetical protein
MLYLVYWYWIARLVLRLRASGELISWELIIAVLAVRQLSLLEFELPLLNWL